LTAAYSADQKLISVVWRLVAIPKAVRINTGMIKKEF
jgi:hypothetical protein